MADKFPSLDDFDEGQTESKSGDDAHDLIDDRDDFLSRERALLGEDANQFSTPQNSVPSVSVQNGHDDLLGDDNSLQANGHNEDMNQFQSSFPSIDTRNERMAPGGTLTGTNLPSRPYSPSPSTASQPGPQDEPSIITDWRSRQSAAISAREATSTARKAETIKAAQESIDSFYENYNNKKEKNVAQTRKEAEEFLAKREDTAAGGTSWERIAKLVDVQGKGGSKGEVGAVGKERFREMLVSLMKDEGAPGAKGY